MKNFSILLLSAFICLLFQITDSYGQNPQTISGGVLNGKATSLVKPVYPPAAQAVDAAGIVNVYITFDERGDVISARAVSGHSLLKKSAENAALASKFSPVMLSGKPVRVSGVLIFNFGTSRATEKFDGKFAEENEEQAINNVATELPSPVYPPAAIAVRASGKVRVRVTLTDKGEVSSATAFDGHPLLKQAALEAAKRAKFDMAKLSKNGIANEGILIYVFYPLPSWKQEK